MSDPSVQEPGKMKSKRISFSFLVGLVLGVVLALLVPPLLGPVLPEAVRGQGQVVMGEVRGKRLQDDRLLLTVQTTQGAILATFKERTPEIDLLVEEGDTVSLRLRRYEPFVEDPAITGVRKRGAFTAPGEAPTEPESDAAAQPQSPLQGPESGEADRAGEPAEEPASPPPDTATAGAAERGAA